MKDTLAVTRLLRDAVKADGELHNLPEVVGYPLQPFVTERPARAPADRGLEDDDAYRPRVLGELLALEQDEFALDLQLTRAPIDIEAKKPPKPELHHALCLKVGGSALVSGPPDAAGCIPVLWVRLTAGK